LGKPVLISQMQFAIHCNISIFKLFVIAHKLFKRSVPFWWWQHVVSKV